MITELNNILYLVYRDLTIWIAIFIYTYPLLHKENYYRRLVFSLISVGLISIGFQMFYPFSDRNIIIYYVIYFILSNIFFFLTTKISWRDMIYGSILAILSQQLTYELWIVLYIKVELFSKIFNDSWKWVGSIWLFLLVYGVIARTIAHYIPENGQYKIGPRQLSSALLLLIIFELLYFILLKTSVSNTDTTEIVILMAQSNCVTLLYLQSALFKKSAMKQEIDFLNQLWHQQKAQYTLAKENISLINHKCHDLKHQMKAIQNMASVKEKEHYLEEVKNSIQIYDSIVNTGNEVLDTVLTEKSLYCEANTIKINCIADGSHMNFMNSIDLYAIFGNALDNAIDCVSKFKNKDKRMIDVLVRTEKKFLVIHIINPVQDKLEFDEELPISTKFNNGQHGFGLKSIRHIVKKYEGFLTVKVENNCFEFKILIPIQ
ncbi:MAG: ATP-binding protein [Lachnotalea sp.]